MDKLLSIALIFIVFVSQFLAVCSVNRRSKIVYVVVGLMPFLVTIVFLLTSSQDLNLRNKVDSTIGWLLPAMLGGQLLAFPVLQKRAGDIFIKVNDVNQKSRRWLLLFLIPVILLFFLSTIPNRFSYSGGGPIYDSQFVISRVPLWIAYTILIVTLLIWIFNKVEIRDKGILSMYQFLDWCEVESYLWYTLDNRLKLSIMPKPKFRIYSTICLVSVEQQNNINEFLKQKGIPQRDR